MAYTARELINDAYYLSGIVSLGLQSVTGEQQEVGLRRLNAAIAMKNPEQTLVPYKKEYVFNAIIGQEEYFIPNLISAESLTFYIQTVRYSMVHASQYQYFATCRAQNVQSLPSVWHDVRTLNGTNIFMYYLPNQAYEMHLWGKFSIVPVQINQDLSLVFDEFYLEYLRQLLAVYLYEFWVGASPLYMQQRVKDAENGIKRIGVLDFTMQKQSQFSPDTYLNYQDYRTGGGWRPV